MHLVKSYWKETISLPGILSQQQKLSRNRAITWPNFRGRLPISNLTCILQWYILLQTFNKINASLQKLLSGNQYQHTKKKEKLSRKRPITQPKFCGWWLISSLTCILHWYILLQTSFNKINASLQVIDRKPISTHQQNQSQKMAITQPKFGGWSQISNLTCIL